MLALPLHEHAALCVAVAKVQNSCCCTALAQATLSLKLQAALPVQAACPTLKT
jgi:hypothetical protein